MTQPTRFELSPGQSGQFSPGKFGDFGVVMVYEDFLAGKRAKATFDRLNQQLGGQDSMKCDMWKFDVLGIPKLNKLAAKDAIKASMVIIAAHEGTELPGPVKRWVGDWLLEKDVRPKALLAILDFDPQPGRSDTPISSYLRRVAQVGQLEFFCHQAKWSESEIHPETESLRQQAENAGVVPGKTLRRKPSYRGYGINE